MQVIKSEHTEERRELLFTAGSTHPGRLAFAQVDAARVAALSSPVESWPSNLRLGALDLRPRLEKETRTLGPTRVARRM